MNHLDLSHIILKKQNHDLLKTFVNLKLSNEGEISKEFETLAIDFNQGVDIGEYQNKRLTVG